MISQHPVSTSTQPVSDYLDSPLTETLCETYGSRLEGMYKLSKLAFRSALSLYAVWVQWQHFRDPQETMLQAVDSVDSALQNDDEDVFNAILACAELPSQSLENLILALTEQIRDNCWSEDPSSQSGPAFDPFDAVLSLLRTRESSD